MKLVAFIHKDQARIGVLTHEIVVDLSVAAPDLPRSMIAFLEAGPEALKAAQAAVDGGHGRIAVQDVTLRAPIERPGKVLAVGLNYADHIAETGREKPEHPMIFNKQSTCVIGTGAAIHVPKVSQSVDYEAELAIVIGRRCRHVPKERASEVIAGYCIMNDVTARDWQMRVPTWTMGKSFDTHGPLGPWITTADEVGNPHALTIRTWVNGELRQDSNTKHLVFDCNFLIEHLSSAFTLEPGDIISTGTPSGVGMAMQPPRFLQPGDVVKMEIEKLGVLENPVIAEPDDTAFVG